MHNCYCIKVFVTIRVGVDRKIMTGRDPIDLSVNDEKQIIGISEKEIVNQSVD